jgi:hypothetical protein
MSVECDSAQKAMYASIPADTPGVWRHTELLAPRPVTASHAYLTMSATFKRPNNSPHQTEPIGCGSSLAVMPARFKTHQTNS